MIAWYVRPGFKRTGPSGLAYRLTLSFDFLAALPRALSP